MPPAFCAIWDRKRLLLKASGSCVDLPGRFQSLYHRAAISGLPFARLPHKTIAVLPLALAAISGRAFGNADGFLS